MSRRVDGAGEDFGDRLAALLPGIPGFENGRGLVQPGHQHRPAGFEHDGGAGIGARDGSRRAGPDRRAASRFGASALSVFH